MSTPVPFYPVAVEVLDVCMRCIDHLCHRMYWECRSSGGLLGVMLRQMVPFCVEGGWAVFIVTKRVFVLTPP